MENAQDCVSEGLGKPGFNPQPSKWLKTLKKNMLFAPCDLDLNPMTFDSNLTRYYGHLRTGQNEVNRQNGSKAMT